MAKEKAMKISDKDAKDKVYEYLRRTNRPYSAVDIINNLKNEITKTSMTKVLDSLVKNNLITLKVNGKQSAFFIKQDDLPTASPLELKAMDVKINALKTQLATLKQETDSLQCQLNTLAATPTDSEIESELTSLNQENSELEQRLTLLREGADSISHTDKLRIDSQFDDMVKHWKKRKKMFKDMWGMMTENYQGKPKDLMEELGLETDEMVKVDVMGDFTKW